MFRLGESIPWALLAIATCGLAVFRLSAGDMPLPAMVVSLVALVSALHRPTRETVVRSLLRLSSGSMIRSLAIVLGAVLMIQLLPLEMGLLLAGDILVYLEAVTAITLIAANTRLRPLVRAARFRLASGLISVRRLQAPIRAQRKPRIARPPKAREDPDRPAWAYA
jgi:hypothetical protein